MSGAAVPDSVTPEVEPIAKKSRSAMPRTFAARFGPGTNQLANRGVEAEPYKLDEYKY